VNRSIANCYKKSMAVTPRFRLVSDVSKFYMSEIVKQSTEGIEEEKALKPGHLYKQKSEQEEFFGIPFSQKKPSSSEDIVAHLRKPFKSVVELLNFYERNREILSKEEPAINYFMNKYCTLIKLEKTGQIASPKDKIEMGTRKRILGDMVLRDLETMTKSSEDSEIHNKNFKLVQKHLGIVKPVKMKEMRRKLHYE